jgi:hypothetical protein
LALWLTKKNIYFILRLNKNTLIKPRYKKYQSLDSLELKPGHKVLYNQILVTEDNQKDRFNVVVYWRRKYNNKQLPSPWYLLTNLENKEEVIKIFANRGGIEVRNAVPLSSLNAFKLGRQRCFVIVNLAAIT